MIEHLTLHKIFRSQRLENLALTLEGRNTNPSIKYTHYNFSSTLLQLIV